jgi:PAS domain S-box-containing protein
MKRTLISLLISLVFISNLWPQGSKELDSLLKLTRVFGNEQLVDVYIEIAKFQAVQNQEEAHQSADEAIRLAKQIKYTSGIGKAYLAKGIICNLNNNPQLGVANFVKAQDIFFNTNDRANLALALLGIGESYTLQGLFEDAAKQYEAAINHLNYIVDYEALVTAYHKKGTNYNMAGNYDKALENFKLSLNYAKNLNDLRGIGLATNSIGIVFYNRGNYKEAFSAWSEYENAMRKLEDWHRVSGALNNKGLIYIRWAAYDEALETFSEALQLEEKSGNNLYIPSIYNTMGTVFHHSGNHQKSFEYYRKSVSFAEKIGSKAAVSVALHNIGEMHLDLGNSDSALYYVQKSLQIENTLFDKVSIAETKATMGKVYLALKKYRLAFSFLEQAEKVFKEVGHKNGLADIYQKFGLAYSDIGNDTLTAFYLNKSNEIALEIDLKRTQYENHQYLANFFEKTSDFKKAYFHQKAFQQINDSIFNQLTQNKTSFLTIKLEKEEQSKELANLQHAQEVLNYKNRIKDSVVYFISLILFILVLAFYFRYSSNKKSTKRLNDQYQIVLESEEKIKALLDASHDIVLLLDRENKIVSANSRADNTLNKGNQIIGFNFLEIVQPLFHNHLDTHIIRVLKQKVSKTFSLTSSDKRTFDVTISPVFKQGLAISGLAIFMKDITEVLVSLEEKKKLEEQLFQVQKLESIGTMAGGVAHDFNNYLGTILGYSSMGYDDSEEGTPSHKYFNQIIIATKSAKHTVQKILTFSRNNENKKLNRVNLHNSAKEALDLVESIRPKEIEIKQNSVDKSVEILGDAIEIQQVFINLFTNAFHAVEGTEHGFFEYSINHGLFKDEHKSIIQSLKTNNIAGIYVLDNGVGMNEQILKRIFEPFFTTKDVGSGTGLGLSIVHGIIKNHQGVLHVESTPNQGSAFYIYLPAIS